MPTSDAHGFGSAPLSGRFQDRPTTRPATRSTVAVLLVATLLLPSGGPRQPPVDAAVARPFVAPAHEYGPGHRGIDLDAPAGTVVRSPAAGTVTFAGLVAGRGVVVVEHAAGTLTSLEPVVPAAAPGTRVARGGTVAVVAAAPPHPGCARSCLHWGVRVDGRYVDPWWWLGRTRPVRLLPLVGPR